jgi:hypothetical protein
MRWHFLPLLMALVSSPGCHVYHMALFAHQDKQPPIDEPLLLVTAPTGADKAVVVKQGDMAATHGRHHQPGFVELVSVDAQTYLHVSEWGTIEAPDLYFFLSNRSLADVDSEHKLLLDESISIKLTRNNLRYSNLGFSGDSLWFLVPNEFADAQSVVIYCKKFSKLFTGTDLTAL